MTRRALALGCGGTIGCAWTVAALAALTRETGIEPANVTLLQGTSAGAELVTMLGGGATVGDLVAMQRGTSDDARLRAHLAATPSSIPPVPAPRLTKPTLLRTQSGLAALTGIAPHGRGDAGWLQRLADAFAGDDGWLPHPGVRMVAFDVDRGERVAFGAPGTPVTDAGTALRASWAIPGWMRPVQIDGRTHVDGGARSTASIDLIGPDEADIVYLIAPMAGAPGERVPGLGGRIENALLRRPMSAVLDREVATLRARGTTVVTITPDRADLAGLGANFMSRRHRRAAFESAMTTAPDTVRRALSSVEA